MVQVGKSRLVALWGFGVGEVASSQRLGQGSDDHSCVLFFFSRTGIDRNSQQIEMFSHSK